MSDAATMPLPSKVTTPDAAVAMIGTGATVMVDGSGGGVNEPDVLLRELAHHFAVHGGPTGLTLVHPSGLGNGNGSGTDLLADAHLVHRVIGGHWGWSPKMQALAAAGDIEAYCLPQGALSQLTRAITAHTPGVLTQVGLGTFVDPRIDGGALNERTTTPLVEVIEVRGAEWLLYHSFPIDVAIIRGSVADELGNLTMDDEGLFAETLSTAQAAKNSGGIVLAQVRSLAQSGTLDARRVKVPGVLVDAVVVNGEQRLSANVAHDPGLTGQLRVPSGLIEPLELSPRKVIARRAACELRDREIINLGFGMPDGVASVLAEERLADRVVFTLEQGHIGGVPASGTDFGLARNQYATIDAPYQFDWYDGGGHDTAVLSFAQVDGAGNVNVGRFGQRLPGVGGFVNISHGAGRVVFVGTFTAKSEMTLGDAALRITREGTVDKFVDHVDQIAFSADRARQRGQSVTYVTERSVFVLGDDGLILTEIAPGADLERDVLAHMAVRPCVSRDLQQMDACLFRQQPMQLVLATNGTRR